MAKVLTKEDLIGGVLLRTPKRVEVGEYEFYIGSCSLRQRNRFFAMARNESGDPNDTDSASYLVACCLRTQDGKPMFSTDDEIKAFLDSPLNDVVMSLADECVSVSGLTKESAEETEKN